MSAASATEASRSLPDTLPEWFDMCADRMSRSRSVALSAGSVGIDTSVWSLASIGPSSSSSSLS